MAVRKKYASENMAKALEDVNRGVPVATAARKYGVPRTTLLAKKEGKTPLICSPGPATILTLEEESILVKWILALADRHFPVTKSQLMDSVQKIMKESKKVKNFGNDNRPSDKWYRLFLKRHPEISPRVCQALTQSREAVTEAQIRNWFSEVKDYLISKDIFEIANDPNRVFNSDESAFYLSPKSDKVLVRKGNKSVYTSAGDEKENLTVLVTTNAAGTIAPSMVVFAYSRVPGYISASMPTGWGIGTSENGWMCAATFYEYICNIFNPWFEEQNIEKPIILFLDGHSSHLTLHLSNFCAANGIELVALYPNSTHLLQPLDVAVFRPLKLAYRNEVQTWKNEHSRSKLLKQDFAPVFNKALTHIGEDTIRNGFRASGICPFEVENVHFEKISKNNKVAVAQNLDIEVDKNFLKSLEKRIEANKLGQFHRCLTENLVWDGPIEDTSLYQLWKELTEKTAPNERRQKGQDREVKKITVGENEQIDDYDESNEEVISNEKNREVEDNEVADPIECTPPKKSYTNEQTDKENLIDIDVAGPSASFDQNVPTPFKKALFWPDPKPVKKRKMKEKIPSVITSEAWREYHAKKEYEKRRKLEEKEQRIAQKKEKRLEKSILEENKKRKQYSDSSEGENDWEESGHSSDDVDIFAEFEADFCELKDINNISVGDYILAKFVGGKRNSTTFRYVCVIQKIYSEQEFEVMCMKSINKDKKMFVFNEQDVSSITKNCVLGVLPTPEILGTGERQKYRFSFPIDIYEA